MMQNEFKFKNTTTRTPERLKNLQHWFASIITQPLIDNKQTQLKTPQGIFLNEEAKNFIIPSPTMEPHERIQLYNQQYWWRLLKILSDHYPLVARLFGNYEFNELLAIPFLQAYPPNTWSLNCLGRPFPNWLNETYREDDQLLVLRAAHLDWIFREMFLDPSYPQVQLSHIPVEKISTLHLKLQPHIYLVHYDCHFLLFRDSFLEQEIEYWVENDFPPLDKDGDYYFLICRTPQMGSHWRRITLGQYLLLQQFKQGSSIEDACSHLEKIGGAAHEEAEESIQAWFQEWTANGWLCVAYS